MSCNQESSKQAQAVGHKIKKLAHPSLVFNNNNVLHASSQKHLGVTLDVKLTFCEHLNNIINKVSKAIGLLRKLQSLLARSTLITINKAFVRTHLDYGGILYDKIYYEKRKIFLCSFHEKLESIQYKACLTITVAIRDSAKERSYQELRF